MEINEKEFQQRLDYLYRDSHEKLVKYALKLTKCYNDAEDLVSDLYEYLILKQNPKIFWGKDSYNIRYCQRFLYTRFINKVKRGNKTQLLDTSIDVEYEETNDNFEWLMVDTHKSIVDELKRLQTTKKWAYARIFELYMNSDKTLEQIAEEIKISKSTTFLAVKKIKLHLREAIQNPYDQENT
jgi:DNA-directed RNA polymerase specialized sigma24 family protein